MDHVDEALDGGGRRAGRRRQRRRRDRDGLPRVQGRDRDRVAGRRRRGRRLDRRRPRPGELRPARLAPGRRRAGRRGDPDHGGPQPVRAGATTRCRPTHRRRPGSGSIIVVVATDAPLLPHQCERLAQRAGLGIARMGGTGSHSSGDLFLCFATGNRTLPQTTFAADPRLTVDVRAVNDHVDRRPVRRRDRGDRGGDPQRADRGRDDDRPRRDHGPRACPTTGSLEMMAEHGRPARASG